MKTVSSSGIPNRANIANEAGAAEWQRPRFLQEVVRVPLGDRVIVDGTERLHVLKTGPNPQLLLDLISAMDGSRTLADLEAAFASVPLGEVQAAVSMLSTYGLVEDDEFQGATCSNIESLSFFRRFVSVTRENSSGRQALERLRNSYLALLAPSQRTREALLLKSILKKTGVGRVDLLDPESLNLRAFDELRPSAQPFFIGLWFGEEPAELFAELDVWCAERQISWLRAVCNSHANYADLGPIFTAKETPCYRCFHAMHSVPSAPKPTDAQAVSATDELFFISLLAVEITYMLSHIGTAPAGRDFRRFDPRTWTCRSLRCTRMPDCAYCQSSGTSNAVTVLFPERRSSLDTAIVFEDYAGLPSRSLAPSKPPLEEHSLAPLYQAKKLNHCPLHVLPQRLPDWKNGILDVLMSGPMSSGQPLTLENVATLLLTTGGIRDSRAGITKVKRWAATAGNLGSVELWLAARNVEGLEPGYYYYQPQHHSLAAYRRRSGALAIDDFMRRLIPDGPQPLPDALLIFTGAFHRVARKYGPFAYRLVNLDAGAAISQLCIVAECLNVAARPACRWADDLIEDQLNLESFNDHCTGVVALFQNMLGGRPGFAWSQKGPRQGVPASAKSPGQFGGLSLQEVLELTHRESRISEKELNLGPFAAPSEFLDSTGELSSPLPLPPARHGGEPVGRVLAARTSVRLYAPKPVSLDQIATMLACAHQGDMQDWPEEQCVGQVLTYRVLTWRAQDLAPGIYQYNPQSRTLSFSHPAPSPSGTVELYVQEEFAAAPLVLWITGNLAAACARHGAFGHRELLLRAGAASHRVWMAAMGMGLAGTIVAGVIPGAARRLFGLDGYTQI